MRLESSFAIALATAVFAACDQDRASNQGSQTSTAAAEPAVPVAVATGGPATGQHGPWIRRAPLPVATRSLASASFAGKIYLFGGDSPALDVPDPIVYPAGAFSRVYAYDPIADRWTTKSPMPIGLYYLTAHAVGDRIYVIGGYDQHGFNPAVLAYDPASDSWSSRSSRPAYSYVFMSTVAGGRIFVVGGQGTIDNGPWASGKPWVYENRVDIYDPVADTWSAGSPAPVPLAEGVACAAGDRVYVFGKAVGSEPGSFAYAYDIVARDWSKVTPPGLPRRGHACVEVNGDFYLLGGNSDAVPADGLEKVEIYSPQADAWRTGDAMPSPRYWMAASSVGPNLFAFGGVDGTYGRVVDTVEMLDLSHPR